jgi:hypothetical protein
MDNDMDKETEQAWHNWVVFTKGTTISVIAVTAILSLMALFLY